jgi:hypothetical protein
LHALETGVRRAEVVVDDLQVGVEAGEVLHEELFSIVTRAVLEDLGELVAKFGFAAAEGFDFLVFEVTAGGVGGSTGDGSGAVNDGSVESDGCAQYEMVNQFLFLINEERKVKRNRSKTHS